LRHPAAVAQRWRPRGPISASRFDSAVSSVHVERKVSLWIAAAVGGCAVGLLSEALTPAWGWDDPGRWAPDLLTGFIWVALGAYIGVAADPRAAGVAALLSMGALSWFAGTVWSSAQYWHRGPLLHLLLTYPGGRSVSRGRWVVVVGVYVAAVVPPLWSHAGSSCVLALATVVAVGWQPRLGAHHRGYRRLALWCAVAVAVTIVVAALSEQIRPGAAAVLPVLLMYEVVLAAVATILTFRLVGRHAPDMTDLVVDAIELGPRRTSALPDPLAQRLGDPTIVMGYWDPAESRYLDSAGNRVDVPENVADRTATLVTRDSSPFAVIVHEAGLLQDPVVAEAVTAATRLTAAHAELQSKVRAQIAETIESRRRLVVAGDEERRRLQQRLRVGPEHQMISLLRLLKTELDTGVATPAANAALASAVDQLQQALDNLHELSRGLHPPELIARGLTAALGDLIERSPVPAGLTATPDRLPMQVEAALYLTCAEALANVIKHARATHVLIDLSSSGDIARLRVRDDGVGGADPAGSGLTGLADRVEALGGRLLITTEAGDGTCLTAEIPLVPGAATSDRTHMHPSNP
jgi:signal transduction histidine kinase